MDVIINNPASQPQFAQPQVQYAPLTQTPSGYGPGYGEYQGHHGGPGFLLPLLLIGGFLFFRGRNKRRRMMQRWQMAGGPATPQDPHAAPDFVDDIRENFRRGRQRFMNDGALGIARERYARGEINADEYQALVKALTGEHGPGRVNIGKDTPPDII
ncbi:SHOCT domain-containing protein [Deinococcus alpinitundrae]|uniref:SHOCT domain-containing protein n=1 Tax=Deinococcus alpinitundrae TaxID=468913 RepID=UPI00137AE539|nr:SHOCT domain-containing protein [Deinococcus alpinitundrae]